ncbi:SMODS domain-containing nucleotidyltransferase [Octadecabacter arcticus]|uniref:SMODS domain-containing nucleotidyltransferase n=1 Tax=Octadecabacter arcticus TaxID=53946 RepID=UPI0026CC4D88
MKNFGFCRSCGIKQKYDDRLGNQQSMLLQEIKVVLLASFPRTTVKGSGPIVEVGFSDYNVEVAPVWGLENQFSYVCMTANGGSYERADYHVETNAISISNTITNGNTRHLVRMMELLSNLVFEYCWSCGDLVGVCGFDSVFERDACDDFCEVVKAA